MSPVRTDGSSGRLARRWNRARSSPGTPSGSPITSDGIRGRNACTGSAADHLPYVGVPRFQPGVVAEWGAGARDPGLLLQPHQARVGVGLGVPAQVRRRVWRLGHDVPSDRAVGAVAERWAARAAAPSPDRCGSATRRPQHTRSNAAIGPRTSGPSPADQVVSVAVSR